MKRLLVIAVLACAVVAGCGGGGGSTATSPTTTSTSTTPTTGSQTTSFPWDWTGTEWKATGTAPACATPHIIQVPINLDLATSVLYPGQVRGDYKAHGGFRFDKPGQTADMSIVAPEAGMLLRVAKYTASGELQITFDYVTDCGFMHRLGHLRELAPRFQALTAFIPQTTDLDSRSTRVTPGERIAAGELIGTATGVRNTANIFLDYGMYDLRARNASSANPAWLAEHDNDTHAYGICWFDYLPAADAARVRALPPGDGVMGKTSDYCR